jgi:hypothetical protein
MKRRTGEVIVSATAMVVAIRMAPACSSSPGETLASSDPQSLTGSCSASVTENVYDGPNYWGTVAIKNSSASAWGGYAVSLTVPSGAHCTNDAVPSGATLSPLTGTGTSAETTSNVCTFTWTQSLAPGATKTFNYSTDATSFSSATNVHVTSGSCSSTTPGSNSSSGSGGGGSSSSGGSSSGSSGGTGSSTSSGSSGGAPSSCPALTTGWAPYAPTHTIQFQGAGTNNEYCSYSNVGGVEHFKMEKNPAGLVQRCEARVNNDYLSGINQFEGDVQILSGDNTCVHQVFMFLMLVAYPENGGELHQHSATRLLPGGVFDNWIHVNTIHNTSTHQADIYLDCAHKLTMSDAPPQDPAGWYDKYGLYGIQTIPPLQQVSEVNWKNIHFYRKP